MQIRQETKLQVQVVDQTTHPAKCHSFVGLDRQIGSSPPANVKRFPANVKRFESTRLPQSVLHASEPSSDFRRNHIADSIMFFDLFSPRSCRRRTMGYFGKQSPKHYFGFPHAGQNSMESGYDYV